MQRLIPKKCCKISEQMLVKQHSTSYAIYILYTAVKALESFHIVQIGWWIWLLDGQSFDRLLLFITFICILSSLGLISFCDHFRGWQKAARAWETYLEGLMRANSEWTLTQLTKIWWLNKQKRERIETNNEKERTNKQRK